MLAQDHEISNLLRSVQGILRTLGRTWEDIYGITVVVAKLITSWVPIDRGVSGCVRWDLSPWWSDAVKKNE
jgi:hypothetical protein